MSFSLFKHGIKTSNDTLTGDAGQAIDSNFKTIANAFDTLLVSTNNLSDLANAATARTNLGLGSAATHAATDFDVAGAASAVQSNLTPGILSRLSLSGGTLTGALAITGRAGTVGLSVANNLTATGTSTLDNGAITTDGAGTITANTINANVYATNVNTHYLSTVLGINFSTGFYFQDDGTGGATINGKLSGSGTALTLPVAPQFKIIAGNLVFTNMPTGPVTLHVYRYTRKKSGAHTSKHGKTYAAHNGKRYYLMQTMTAFSGTWHFSDIVSVYRGATGMKRGDFRFAYVYPGGEGPQSKSVKASAAAGGVVAKVKFI